MSLSPLVAGIAESQVPWLNANAPDADVILSCKIHFLRNLAGLPFPVNASKTIRQKVNQLTEESLQQICGEASLPPFYKIQLSELGVHDREILQERKLIPSAVVKGHHCKDLFLSPQNPENPWLLTNYDSHLNIQAMAPGQQLDLLWQKISPFEQQLSAKMPFAFRRDLGYLTAQPCHTGTAMLVSALVHLPCICLSGKEKTLLRSLEALRLKAKSYYGKDNHFPGGFFVISNQSTMGESEEELLLRFQKVLKTVTEEERSLRKKTLTDKTTLLQNLCCRAFGMLKYSYLISQDEALTALSSLKLGIDSGLIGGTPADIFYRLLIPTQEAHTHLLVQPQNDPDQKYTPISECPAQRAGLIRNAMEGLQVSIPADIKS